MQMQNVKRGGQDCPPPLRASESFPGGLSSCDGYCGFRLLVHSLLCLLGLLALWVLLFDGADLHTALEDRSILNADPLGNHVARQRTLTTNIHAIRNLDVAVNLAQNDDFASTDAGSDDAIAANGYTAIGEIDRPLDFAVYVERFGAGDFTLDHQRTPNGGLPH